MKKLISLLKINLFILLSFSFCLSATAEPKNLLLEYATGTWCVACPCAHQTIDSILLVEHPEMIVLAYHGPYTNNDPWKDFPGREIIDIAGYNAYPTGTINRQSGIRLHAYWAPYSTAYSTDEAAANISVDQCYDRKKCLNSIMNA